MDSNADSQRLSLLRAESDRALRALLRSPGLPLPAVGPAGEAEEATPASLGVFPAVVSRQAGPLAATLTVNVNLVGQTIFLDDERRVRALAKEIKRLISEDKRRGLAV